MTADEVRNSRPVVRVNALECKACGRCVLACPAKCLELGNVFNARGYQHVVYKGSGCVGCGNCFLTCPEPSAIEVT